MENLQKEINKYNEKFLRFDRYAGKILEIDMSSLKVLLMAIRQNIPKIIDDNDGDDHDDDDDDAIYLSHMECLEGNNLTLLYLQKGLTRSCYKLALGQCEII